ncbi:MAG: hypothetical protein ACTHJ7_04045 [Candidatus Nitrosocosmicus sp.]
MPNPPYYKCLECGKREITFNDVLQDYEQHKDFLFVCNICKIKLSKKIKQGLITE